MLWEPREHQQLALDHLRKRERVNKVAAIFAGMGLGKTATTLAAMGELIADGSSRGALVIAPLRVSLFTWTQEAAKWSNLRWMKVVSLRTEEGLEAWERGDACIYTVNYESLFIPRRDPKTGETVDHGLLSKLIKGKRSTSLPVDTVIWDELTKAKNHASKRIREFRKYRSKFQRHWGLTGTPTPNGLLDLFAQIKLLDDGETFGRVMGNYKLQYFYPVDFHQRKWEVREGCTGMIEEKLSKLAITLRSEDYLDIPPVTTTDIEVSLPTKVKALYKRLEKEMLILLQDDKIKAVNQAVLVNKLQQVVGGACYAEDTKSIFRGDDTKSIFRGDDTKTVTEIHDTKTKALRKLWESEGKKPMLVAVKFKHEISRVIRDIPEAVAFDSKQIDPWNRGEVPMLVCHPASMSHGLNMQSGGSRICWYSHTYSREEFDQLNARLARTGQGEETRIFRLVCSGTIDDAIIAAVEAKGNTQSAFLQTLTNLQTLNRIK